jgi:hypothetical protein
MVNAPTLQVVQHLLESKMMNVKPFLIDVYQMVPIVLILMIVIIIQYKKPVMLMLKEDNVSGIQIQTHVLM